MDSDETPFRAWWKRQAWIRFLILLIAAWFLLMFILLPLTRIMSTGIVKCPQRLPELEGTIGKEQDTWERTFSLLGIVVAFGAAVFYRQFMPTVNVRLAPEWKDPANGILSLSLEVENNSRIGIRRDKSSVCCCCCWGFPSSWIARRPTFWATPVSACRSAGYATW